METVMKKSAIALWMLVVSASFSAQNLGAQTPQIPQPNSSSLCNVRSYGALGDGNTLDTAAISKAIQACADAGGGVVDFPPGRYVAGTLEMRSNITLYLEPGAVLAGSKNLNDYGSISEYGFGRDYGVNYTGEGFKVGMIVARNVQNVAILGRGAIDGNGDNFMDLTVPHVSRDFDPQYTRQGQAFLNAVKDTQFGPVEPKDHGEGRPGTMVVFTHCRNIVMRDVTLENAPNWTLDFQSSQRIVVNGAHIHSSLLIPNDDGMDCIDCKDVHVSDCDIQSGDDDFAFFHSEDVNVANCSLISRSSAIRLEDTRLATFTNLSIRSNRGIGIYHRPGESTEDVLFSNIVIETHLITGHWWGKAEPIYIAVSPGQPNQTGGFLRDLRFSNITGNAESGMVIYGSKDEVIQGLDFNHIKLRIVSPPAKISDAVGGNFDLRWTATSLANAIFKHDIPGIYCQYVQDFHLQDVQIVWGGELASYFSQAMECHHFQDLDIDGFTGRQARLSSREAAISLSQGSGVTIRNSTAQPGTATFLSLSQVTDERLFVNNDLGAAKQVMRPAKSDFKMFGNIIAEPQPGQGRASSTRQE
jgi:Pectate lyase superfamily protein/Glycosyl hydrolases family 28